jgi:hypothetical protein
MWPKSIRLDDASQGRTICQNPLSIQLGNWIVMWPRETIVRSGDIGAQSGCQKAEPKSLGFAARHRTERFEAKRPKEVLSVVNGFFPGVIDMVVSPSGTSRVF